MSDLALILVVAGAVTLLFKKLRQPLVLGYIIAGFLVSPHMPYTMSVVDKGDVEMWAEIGVMFLLFSLASTSPSRRSSRWAPVPSSLPAPSSSA